MTMWIKQGVENATGQYIYPHPNQTNTGNCAAYTGAACLYAFGLDHHRKLIPVPEPPATPDQAFQWSITKMVERLTALIYSKAEAIESPAQADGYRRYIEECELSDRYQVSEQPTMRDGRTNFPFIISELKRCQNIILNIKFDETTDDPGYHSVGLVGIDEDANEVVFSNPWGGGLHATPDEAVQRTASGLGGAFDHRPYRIGFDGTVRFEFMMDPDNRIDNIIMICPVPRPRARVRGGSRIHPHGSGSYISPVSLPPEQRREYDYTVASDDLNDVNGVAIGLPGLAAENILALDAPNGWSAGPWYRERKPGFDHLVPERRGLSEGLTFAGVIWRTKTRPISAGESLEGFRVAVSLPERRGAQESAWEDNPAGHAIVLQEQPGVQAIQTTAWHVSTLTPSRRNRNRKPPNERAEE